MARLKEAIGDVLLLWKSWRLQGFIVFSLFIQCFLFLAAPLRKSATSAVLAVLIWSAYQLWDKVITNTLAFINSGNTSASSVDLYAFWASFCLLHFGGQDTMTALAVEDNHFWNRTALDFVGRCSGLISALAAVPGDKLRLTFIAAILISLAGIAKSLERILSLKQAGFGLIQQSLLPSMPNPGPDYAEKVENHKFNKIAGVESDGPAPATELADSKHLKPPMAAATGVLMVESLDSVQVAKQAFRFFGKFKGTYVNMVFSRHDREEAREFFLGLSSRDAFRVLETETGLAYETFYTKMPLMVNRMWLRGRCLAICLEFTALALWFSDYKRHEFPTSEVLITSFLVVCAFLIDVTAMIKIFCSERMIGHRLSRSQRFSKLKAAILFPLHCARGLSRDGNTKSSTETPLFHNWSERISQFNLITYCLDERPKFMSSLYTLVGAKDMMDSVRYVFKRRFTDSLRDFISEELQYKSIMAENPAAGEEISLSRGEWILSSKYRDHLDSKNLDQWIMDVEFDESVLIWHIATELCYETGGEPNNHFGKRGNFRDLSKVLSDYMLYLLIRQPTMMSEMAPMAKIIFNDTCEEAKQLFKRKLKPEGCLVHGTKRVYYRVMDCILSRKRTDCTFESYLEKKKKVHSEACERIMEVPIHVPPRQVKGDSGNSVLFEACELANKLKEMGDIQWEMTSRIWVELLCYAAAQSPANVHVVQLSKGGELVTLVRLLMLHLGLSNQFCGVSGAGAGKELRETP